MPAEQTRALGRGGLVALAPPAADILRIGIPESACQKRVSTSTNLHVPV